MENKSKALECLRIPRSSFYYTSVLNSKDLELKTKIETVMGKHWKVPIFLDTQSLLICIVFDFVFWRKFFGELFWRATECGVYPLVVVVVN